MCCGSDDDYYTVSSYQQETQRPKAYATAGRPRQQAYPQYQYHPQSREEAEKRQRQAQATAAAHKYGWPTARGAPGNVHQQYPNNYVNRDSMIEPNLAGGLAAMPGSEFRAVYDPQRARQAPPRRPVPQRQQPVQNGGLPRQSQRPPPQQRIVYHQPGRTPAMRAEPTLNNRSVPQQRPGVGRRPDIHAARPVSEASQTAEIFPRRDSNGVSVCSDDEDYQNLRNYTVSPLYPAGYVSPPPILDRTAFFRG
ncbi:hypothetical protein GGS21DRAFT_455917 [Xylaria nigripes]|nr:hypothetical protein GGS21DRAFT_455917 [Xylaria nigripes]